MEMISVIHTLNCITLLSVILGNTSSLEESSKNHWSLMYMILPASGKSTSPVGTTLCISIIVPDTVLNTRMEC